MLLGASHTLAVDASSVHVQRQMAGVQQLMHSAPTIAKCWSFVAVNYAQNKAQKHHPREFPGYWWLFECNAYRVTALDWLKKEVEQF